MRVPGNRLAQGAEATAVVVEHCARDDLEQPLLRCEQPVERRRAGRRVEAEASLRPVAQIGDLDMVRHADVVPAEPRRIAGDLVGQRTLDRIRNNGNVLRSDKELQSRPEAVVGRARVVEAEHVGAPAQERRRMRHGDDRRQVVFVEASCEVDARDVRVSHTGP